MGKELIMAIRKIKEITAKEENFRVEQKMVKRDSIEPVPVGTLIVEMFRIVGYDKDCDSSLMARLESIDTEGKATGWTANGIGLYPDSTWQIDSPTAIENLVSP